MIFPWLLKVELMLSPFILTIWEVLLGWVVLEIFFKQEL